jgi:hypothetical protein
MICSVVPFQVTFRRINGFVDRVKFLALEPPTPQLWQFQFASGKKHFIGKY